MQYTPLVFEIPSHVLLLGTITMFRVGSFEIRRVDQPFAGGERHSLLWACFSSIHRRGSSFASPGLSYCTEYARSAFGVVGDHAKTCQRARTRSQEQFYVPHSEAD